MWGSLVVSSYGGLVIILIFVVGFVALMCGIIGSAQSNSGSSRSRKELTANQLVKRILEEQDKEDEEDDFEMLWSEGGDMDDSF